MRGGTAAHNVTTKPGALGYYLSLSRRAVGSTLHEPDTLPFGLPLLGTKHVLVRNDARGWFIV